MYNLYKQYTYTKYLWWSAQMNEMIETQYNSTYRKTVQVCTNVHVNVLINTRDSVHLLKVSVVFSWGIGNLKLQLCSHEVIGR